MELFKLAYFSRKSSIAIILVLLALAVRASVFCLIGISKESDYPNRVINHTDLRSRFYGNGYINDTIDYQDLANNIVSGNGFSRAPQKPTAFRSPVYPYFLALIFFLFGIGSYVTIWANIILSSISLLPLFYIIRHYSGLKAGIIGAVFYCFMPQSVFWSIGAFSEPLLALLLLLSWAFWIKGDFHGKAYIGSLIVFSILMSLLILIKIYLAGILIFLLLFSKSWKRLKYLVLILLIAVAPSLIWAGRNYHEFGRFSISSSGGYNYWKGVALPLGYFSDPFYNQDSDRQARQFLEEDTASNREFIIQDSLYADARVIIGANLIKVPRQIAIKAISFFRLWPNNTSFISGLIYFLPLLGLYLLGILEIIYAFRRKLIYIGNLLFLLSVFLTIFPIMCIFWNLGRFRFPFDITLIPFAAAGLLHITDKNKML